MPVKLALTYFYIFFISNDKICNLRFAKVHQGIVMKVSNNLECP